MLDMLISKPSYPLAAAGVQLWASQSWLLKIAAHAACALQGLQCQRRPLLVSQDVSRLE